MTQVALDLPDVKSALAAIDDWSSVDADFAALLATGMPKGQAVARWGLLLLKASRSLDAITALRVAAALSPEDPGAWTNLGIALDRAGSTTPAEHCFERSLGLLHVQPHTWLLLGLARKKQGDPLGAEKAYRVALEQDATSAVVWQCLGLLKEEQRDYVGAAHCFATCAKYGAPSPAIAANLGKLNYQIGRFSEAHEAFAVAVNAEPSNLHYRTMLGKARFLLEVSRGTAVDIALDTLRESKTLGEQVTESQVVAWLDAAGGLLSSFGQVEGAVRVTQKRLELQPNSSTAKYLLRALQGQCDIERSPTDYIVENFDAFAESFNAKLVGMLGYDIPEKIHALVRPMISEGTLCDVLDAGCGTGLCGSLFRPMARRLVGVDLSPKMIDQAEKTKNYDALSCDDLALVLLRAKHEFDIIVAADVILYFGDLASLFPEAAGALREGGLFVFSVEAFSGKGYRLGPSGRFAHNSDYVRAAAHRYFTVEAVVDTTIRIEGTERVPGNLFALRSR